jgi:hypothetical protein
MAARSPIQKPVIFIASSTEGLKDAAEALQDALKKRLKSKAEVNLWTQQFEVSATYIESLERFADTSDFAVLVATADDVTDSRGSKSASPRDNVIFELGLFMGRLGRDRCILVVDRTATPKLPSDLQGVHSAGFQRVANRGIRTALADAIRTIETRVQELGVREKLSRELIATQESLQRYCHMLEGAWWQRISEGKENAISFVEITADPLLVTVTLDGRAFDDQGRYRSSWGSKIARVDKDNRTIEYQWEGRHADRARANAPYAGFGNFAFDRPVPGDDPVDRGIGTFWNINEAQPKETQIVSVEVRRIHADEAVNIMKKGNARKQAALLKKVLQDW